MNALEGPNPLIPVSLKDLPKLLLSALVVCWAGLGPAAAYELPDIGDPSGSVITPQDERQLGTELMRTLRRQLMILEDPWLEEYIQSLGYRLVAHSDDQAYPFTFFIVRDGAINAFAAPGGYIGLNSGLVLTTESESELAAVVAHEIAHITQRHMARMYEAAGRHQMAAAIALLAAILVGGQSDDLGEAAVAAGAAAGAQMQINFTRANEQEADRVGMQILASSGFEPDSMAAFFERMQRATRLYGARLPEFLSTHPVTNSRIADARSRAQQLPTNPADDQLNYYLARARLRVLTAEDPARVEQEFRQYLADDASHNERAARYGHALALLELGNYDQARQEIERLRESDPERIPFLITAGRIEMRSGHMEAAAELFEEALLIYPHNRALTYHYAEGLIRAQRAAEAQQRLETYLRNREPDAAIHRLYAEAAGTAGDNAEAYQHLAEYYFINGETRTAIEKLTQASRLDGLDYYQAAEIDARLKQLQRIAAQEQQ